MKHNDETYRERYVHRCRVIATIGALVALVLAAVVLLAAQRTS